MNRRKWNKLQQLPDHELELLAGNPDHEDSEIALDVLSERAAADGDPRVAQALGYTGDTDYFCITPRM